MHAALPPLVIEMNGQGCENETEQGLEDLLSPSSCNSWVLKATSGAALMKAR